MTALIAIIVLAIITAAKTTSTGTSAEEGPTDPEGPAPRPRRPHIRGPPRPSTGNMPDDETLAGGTVPPAHDPPLSIPDHPRTTRRPARHTKIPPTDTPMM